MINKIGEGLLSLLLGLLLGLLLSLLLGLLLGLLWLIFPPFPTSESTS